MTNAGNTVVDRAIGDDEGDALKMQALQVHMRTLDHVLWPQLKTAPPQIPLMKLDAQGYEEQVLYGARRLLGARAIQTIKLELAPHWLHNQNSSVIALYNLLSQYGFKITASNNRHPIKKAVLFDLDRQTSPLAILDIVATLG